MAGSAFGTALSRMVKNNSNVARNTWFDDSEKMSWVLYFNRKKEKIYLDKNNDRKTAEEWVPNQEDILATDWYVTF